MQDRSRNAQRFKQFRAILVLPQCSLLFDQNTQQALLHACYAHQCVRANKSKKRTSQCPRPFTQTKARAKPHILTCEYQVPLRCTGTLACRPSPPQAPCNNMPAPTCPNPPLHPSGIRFLLLLRGDPAGLLEDSIPRLLVPVPLQLIEVGHQAPQVLEVCGVKEL